MYEKIFEEEREEVLLGSNGKEYEDATVIINSALSLTTDLSIESCNVLFDISSGASITSKGNCIKIIDSCVVFDGESQDVINSFVDCKIVFEDCKFSQINAKHKKAEFNIFFKATMGRVEINNCEFEHMIGRIFQSDGTDLYIEKIKVSNISGEFYESVQHEEEYPSVVIKDSEFKNINFPVDVDYSSTKKVELSFGAKSEGPAVFDIKDAVRAEISNLSFSDIDIMCISNQAYVGGNRKYCEIKKCSFKKCRHNKKKPRNQYEYTWEQPLDFCINANYGVCHISDCKIVESRGVHIFPQYADASIRKCSFEKCQAEDTSRFGILDILTETDKDNPLIVEDCTFKKCKVICDGSSADHGIIYITGGMAQRAQTESVHLKNVIFEECESDYEVCGKEKMDGFFGGTVTYYKIL